MDKKLISDDTDIETVHMSSLLNKNNAVPTAPPMSSLDAAQHDFAFSTNVSGSGAIFVPFVPFVSFVPVAQCVNQDAYESRLFVERSECSKKCGELNLAMLACCKNIAAGFICMINSPFVCCKGVYDGALRILDKAFNFVRNIDTRRILAIMFIALVICIPLIFIALGSWMINFGLNNGAKIETYRATCRDSDGHKYSCSRTVCVDASPHVCYIYDTGTAFLSFGLFICFFYVFAILSAVGRNGR